MNSPPLKIKGLYFWLQIALAQIPLFVSSLITHTQFFSEKKNGALPTMWYCQVNCHRLQLPLLYIHSLAFSFSPELSFTLYKFSPTPLPCLYSYTRSTGTWLLLLFTPLFPPSQLSVKPVGCIGFVVFTAADFLFSCSPFPPLTISVSSAVTGLCRYPIMQLSRIELPTIKHVFQWSEQMKLAREFFEDLKIFICKSCNFFRSKHWYRAIGTGRSVLN